MKVSKYLGKTFDNWTCTYVGIANIQGAKKKRPGHRNYYYVFERRTSDNLADKIIKLNSAEASKVWKRLISVEELLDKRESKRPIKFMRSVTYKFD